MKQKVNSQVHPIRKSNFAGVFAYCILTPRIFPSTMRYLYTVTRYFFFPQFHARLKIKKDKVVYVDHALDRGVPFRPEKIDVYLRFIAVWVTALGYIRKHLGKRAHGEMAAYLDSLSDWYLSAYQIYSCRFSSTERPKKAANSRLQFVYMVDPHLLCVPSLHVIIVCHAFISFSDIFKRKGLLPKHEDALVDLYRQALDITETTIYVKQHSVNCISAALFMVSQRFPAFGLAKVSEFVKKLFLDDPDVRHRAKIHAYLIALYKKFMAEARKKGAVPSKILVNFLLQLERKAS